MSHASRQEGPDRPPLEGFSLQGVRLAWVLALAYMLVIAYASLQPFQGWRVPPDEIRRFLFAPWSRYVMLQDIVINLGAYAPLGFLLSIGFGARWGAARGAAAAVLVAAALSLSMESVQMFLPARIASNVDLLVNSLGALIGAMAAPLFAPTRILGDKLRALRHRFFVEGMAADMGVVVVGLWLLTQFHPNAQLFGTGDVRMSFGLPARFDHTPWLALGSEGVVALFNLLGVGLLLAACTRPGERRLLAISAVIAAALLIKTLTAVAAAKAAGPLGWMTPGALSGLLAGVALLWGAVHLPRRMQVAASAACIVIATLAINLAPANPYLTPPSWLLAGSPSHFLSFSGIVRALAELWPLLAVSYLIVAVGKYEPGTS